MTAPFNIMEPALFRRRYLKINNSAVKEYLFSNEILWFFRRYIQNPVYETLLGYVEICHFYPILSVVYFSPRHDVVSTKEELKTTFKLS